MTDKTQMPEEIWIGTDGRWYDNLRPFSDEYCGFRYYPASINEALKARVEVLEGAIRQGLKSDLSDEDYTKLVSDVRKFLELGMFFGDDPIEQIVYLTYQTLTSASKRE